MLAARHDDDDPSFLMSEPSLQKISNSAIKPITDGGG